MKYFIVLASMVLNSFAMDQRLLKNAQQGDTNALLMCTRQLLKDGDFENAQKIILSSYYEHFKIQNAAK